MACWSPENATNAYLRAIKLGKSGKELDTSEFISALVAGMNARLMVVACAGAADGTTLALVAAAHQTGGRVVCIVNNGDEVQLSQEILGENAGNVEFVVGDAEMLVAREYRDADCVVVDCRIHNCEGIVRSVRRNRSMVLGYNAFSGMGFGLGFEDANLLPIGEGLLVSRIRRSRWVVKVDKFTGEEHVFRVTKGF